MNRFPIPHDALVFVGDGQRALFLRNAGDSTLPNLTTERVLTDANLPTHEQGTDRPGRVFKRAGTNLRSGVDTTDWHELEKERFAKRVASALEHMVRTRKGQSDHNRCPAAHARGIAQRPSCRREKPDRRRNRQGPDQAPDRGDRETSRRVTGKHIVRRSRS